MSIPTSRLTTRTQFILYVDYWTRALGWELNQENVDKLFNLYFGPTYDEYIELTEQAAFARAQKKSKK